MKQPAHIIAQRLLNLYRQAHVINGGWAAVNQVFIAESNDPKVTEELAKMPTGKRLVTHIENLRSGKTKMDAIESELLPYGGIIAVQEAPVKLTDNELAELKSALDSFEPNPEGLEKIKQLGFVSKFGSNWTEDIKSMISHDTDMLTKWEDVTRTARAYQMWDSAKQLISEDLTERDRAKIQADMPEFETYLPMFGDEGNKVLAKLRTFISSAS